METPSAETISTLIHAHRSALSLTHIDKIEVTRIGQGEANLNVRVTVNQTRHFNLRIGLRETESDATLQNEYNVLQVAPPAISPRAYLLDLSRTYLSRPYILLDFIVGDLKPVWNMDDMRNHGRALAYLHTQKFDKHGRPDALTAEPYDIVARFDASLKYWRAHHPYLLELPIEQRLIPPIRRFMIDHAHLFRALTSFSVIHGDAHPLNILFSGSDVYYIDWEWGAIGDPAADVAMLGWDIATGWQMALIGTRLKAFLDTYLKLAPDDTLLQRREVWMIYTMCFDQLYHRTRLDDDEDGRQAYTVRQIEAYLIERFLT